MIVNKPSLVTKINEQLADNSTQEISPRDIRDNLLDIIDSVHLFTADQNLEAQNFATPSTRTTRAGEDALGSLKLAGYSSVDNSAFGFSALKGNYDGTRNTAIGTYSMSCNLYGSTNVAIGYNSLAGNVFGSNNVSLGSYTLQSNKRGNNNIAIGHGAGYYIGEDDNYKLFVASHDINNDDLCTITPGSGPNPLIYGDLQGNRLGVNTTLLHSFGTLQVNGVLSPTSGNMHDLGFYSPTYDYRWRNAHLSNSINEKIYFNDSSAARVKGDIVPDVTNIYKIGDSGRGLLWDGYFNDLTVSGVANITNLNWTTISECIYDCRTLYLASSGMCSSGNHPCGYLSDTQIEGGGIVLQASGTDYKRDYHWTYLAPDYSQLCVAPDLSGDDSAMAHASWYSNISVKIESGRHVKTDRVVGRDFLSLANTNDCFGVFLRKDSEEIRTGKNWRNEKQRLAISATSGTFTITYKETESSASSTTAALAYNATASEIQAALEAIGPSVSVLQSDNTEYFYGITARIFVIEFTGSLSKKNIPLMTVDSSSLVGASTGSGGGSTTQCRTIPGVNEIQTLDIVADGGTFILKNGNDPVTHSSFGLWEGLNQLIPYNVSEANLKAAIEDSFGKTAVYVARASLSVGYTYNITFDGDLGQINHGLLVPDLHGLTLSSGSAATGGKNERKKIKVVGDAGKWKIGWKASGASSYTYSSSLSASATLSDVDSALDGLLGGSNHQTIFNSTTETAADGSTWIVKEYEVTFISALGDRDIDDDQLIAISDSSDPLRKSGASTSPNVPFIPQSYMFVDGFNKDYKIGTGWDATGEARVAIGDEGYRYMSPSIGDVWMTADRAKRHIGSSYDSKPLYFYIPFIVRKYSVAPHTSSNPSSKAHMRDSLLLASIPLTVNANGDVVGVQIGQIIDALSERLSRADIKDVTLIPYNRKTKHRQGGTARPFPWGVQNINSLYPQSYFMHETEGAKFHQALQTFPYWKDFPVVKNGKVEKIELPWPSILVKYNGPVAVREYEEITDSAGRVTSTNGVFLPTVDVIFGGTDFIGGFNKDQSLGCYIGHEDQRRSNDLHYFGGIQGGTAPALTDNFYNRAASDTFSNQRRLKLRGGGEMYYKVQVIKSDFAGGVNANDLLKSTYEIMYTSDVISTNDKMSVIQTKLDKNYSGYIKARKQDSIGTYNGDDDTNTHLKPTTMNGTMSRLSGIRKDIIVGLNETATYTRYGVIFDVVNNTLSKALYDATNRSYEHVQVGSPIKWVSNMSAGDYGDDAFFYIRYCDKDGNDLPYTRTPPSFNSNYMEPLGSEFRAWDDDASEATRSYKTQIGGISPPAYDTNRLAQKPHLIEYNHHRGGDVPLMGSASVSTLVEGNTATTTNQASATSNEAQAGRAPREDCIILGGGDIDPVLTITAIQDGTDLIDDSAECVDNVAYITEEPLITPNPLSPSGKLGNIGDVNFISSGCASDYVIAYSTIDSGHNITQRYASNIQTTLNENKTKEKINGFDLTYKDEGEQVDDLTDQKKDRFTISAYDNSIIPINALTIMRSRDVGLVGITDMLGNAEEILPETIFNIQATGIPENRTTGAGGSKLQLLGGANNKKKSGLEIEYVEGSRVANINMFRDFDKEQAVRISADNHISIGHPNPNEILTIGSGVSTDNKAAISIIESSGTVSATNQFGKVYVKEVEENNQCQSIFFLDDCGNEFDLVGNKFAVSGDRVYTDDKCNTHVGNHSPDDRHLIASKGSFGNTTLGSHALQELTYGADNIAIGCEAGSGVTAGWQNILIGNRAGAMDLVQAGYSDAEVLTTGFRNTIIGHNLDGGNSSYTFLLGADNQLLLSGVMGPSDSDKILSLPRGKFSITSSDGFDKLTLDSKTMKLTDLANEYPDQSLDFVFEGPNSNNVLTSNTMFSLKHHVSPMDPTCCTYNDASPERPYATLNGDLRLAGSLRFCDGTSMDSATLLGGLNAVGRSGIKTEISSSENSIDLAIERLKFNTAANATDFYIPVASGTIHSKINFTDLAGYISPLSARIDNCEDGQAGYRYLFTNNSTIGELGCNTVYIGNEAGHNSNGWNHSVMIGTHAGRSSTISYSSESEHASVFIGHQAGEDTVGCYSSTFIGPNAGFNADNSYRSVFIGDEAGQNANTNRSVGIGDNALEGVTGTHNIEICTGIGKDGSQPWETRLMTGNMSHKMNIGDILAGDMGVRRMNVGSANVHCEDAVWSVRKDSYQGHNDIEWIQDSQQDDVRVAGIKKDGVPFAAFTKDSGEIVGRIYIEGYAQASIASPSSSDSPTEGQILIKDSSWGDDILVTISNRDTTLDIQSGDYVVAILINGEYRPIWVSCQS
jgi:hypothetical protein